MIVCPGQAGVAGRHKASEEESMTSQDLGAAGGFPPHVLREYALVADGERGALVRPPRSP